MESYRHNPPQVAALEVLAEVETQSGWSFDIEILWTAAGSTRHQVTLSWVDHDHLSGGRVPPSKVAEAIANTVAAVKGPLDTPVEFDASTARRWIENLDAQVRQQL